MRIITSLLLLLLLTSTPLLAGDIESTAHFGNIGFLWSAVDPIAAGTTFPATNWNYGATVSYTDQLAENFTFKAQYSTDTILRHLVKGYLSFQTGILTITGGPILGVFNSVAMPIKGGIAVGLSLKLPGILIAEFSSEASMGAGLYTAGDYIQEAGRIAAGFYVPNAICTASVYTRKYYNALTATTRIIDSSVLYNFNVDVFKKGVPYRLIVDLGYEDIARSYADTTVDQLASIILGAKVHAIINSTVSLNIGGRFSVFSFGMQQLELRGPPPASLLFQSSAGVVIHL